MPARLCLVCEKPIPNHYRSDKKTCGDNCRKKFAYTRVAEWKKNQLAIPENHEAFLKYYAKYREEHRSRIAEQCKKSYQKNKDKQRKNTALKYAETRRKCIEFLTDGKMACARCGYSDIRALQFDHIHGGGTYDRTKRKYHGIHKQILENPNSKKIFQVLCANCNWIKKHERQEKAKGWWCNEPQA